MSETPATQPKRSTMRLRLIFLACAIALLGGALAVGISDNPPGIALAFLSSVAVVLALTIDLRTLEHYLHLLLGSLASLVAAVILHNVFEAAASVAGAAWLRAAGEAVGVAFFLAAIFLCPAGIVVGGVGTFVKLLRPGPRPA
jgi:hypothetical protein